MVEPTSVGSLPDLVREGALPASCGKRIRDDNPLDPLHAAVAKIVKGEPTKPGAYPWQVKKNILFSSSWCNFFLNKIINI